jgi:hypothetical protein
MRLHSLIGLLAGLCLLSSVGCLSFYYPIETPGPEVTIGCQELPKACKDHVYIFVIHGLDPLDLANLNGLCDYIHHLGFNKTYYGQLYSRPVLEQEMLKIQESDPGARYVVIGFSFGANQARDLTHFAGEHGIHVDLLVYLGGNTLENVPADRPENTTTIVNILASGCIWNGAQLDGAINMEVSDVHHFGSPTHPRTLDVLTRELTSLAAAVPFVDDTMTRQTLTQDEPTPRGVKAVRSAATNDWDFLKPVSLLRSKGN